MLTLSDWISEEGDTRVAMESAGVYWNPVYKLLEERKALLLANTHHSRPCQAARPRYGTVNGSPACFAAD